MAVQLAADGQLDKVKTRDSFAVASISPPNNTFSELTFFATSFEEIGNLTSFGDQVDFTDDGSFLDRMNLASVSISSQLSNIFQTFSNPNGELRPLIFTFFDVDSPFFQDTSLTDFTVGSIIFSVIVGTEMENVTFENFSSPIEFKFQVTEVHTKETACSNVAWPQISRQHRSSKLASQAQLKIACTKSHYSVYFTCCFFSSIEY